VTKYDPAFSQSARASPITHFAGAAAVLGFEQHTPPVFDSAYAVGIDGARRCCADVLQKIAVDVCMYLVIGQSEAAGNLIVRGIDDLDCIVRSAIPRNDI
jgi:hypothetical protein